MVSAAGRGDRLESKTIPVILQSVKTDGAMLKSQRGCQEHAGDRDSESCWVAQREHVTLLTDLDRQDEQ
eukprot:1815794-Prymnesium_polylepis.1